MSRVWYAQDAGFLSDPRIQQLGAKYGPGGPLAITHMLGVAKLQSLTGEYEEGHVKLGYAALAYAVFLPDWKQATAIVQEAVRLQILELVEDTPDDFEVRFLRWSEYQQGPKDPDSARRARAYRERKRTPVSPEDAETERDDGVTRHVTSRDANVRVMPNVTGTYTEDQDRKSKTSTSPRSVDADSVRVVRETSEPALIDAAAGKAEELCVTLADLIEENGSKRPTITNAWRVECRRMLTADNRDAGEAEALLRWCQGDAFWKANILSMPKFRKQYDRLRLRMLNESPGHRVNSVDSHVEGLLAQADELRRRGR